MEIFMVINYIKEKYKLSDERMAICNECEHLKKDSKKCELCGCFMEYKTMLPFAACPIGKWNAEEDK